MNTSVAWINDYLAKPLSASQQADCLTRAGFPLEHTESITLADGTLDTRQDIELTSNRGDCLCHLGLAREIAAVSGSSVKWLPTSSKATGPKASTITKVTNQEPGLCPLYTARIIRGIKVGPSPKWLANRLLARGDIPRNNVVDASNFVLFELGQPTHVFDLAKLKGNPPQIIIRKAKPNEPFLPIGEGAVEVKLSHDDLVIADAERAVAIAGVKGGALTAVSNTTTDILIEAATFDRVTIRQTSRRLGIASDSSYRFERGVHAGQINEAADRLVQFILELCGGTLCEGVVSDGVPIAPRQSVSMRCDRCRAILGIPITDERMVEVLTRLGFEPVLNSSMILCTVPHQRMDVQAEIDLIEEVGRIVGLDEVPIEETIRIRVTPAQPQVQARRAVADALVGMGYVETVTHSLIDERAAAAFLPPGMELLRVADDRTADTTLRPSILPSLLRVFAFNHDRAVKGVQLFESGSTFATLNGSQFERTNLAFVHAADAAEDGIRRLRSVIDRLVQVVLGPQVRVDIAEMNRLPWFATGTAVHVNGEMLGTFGVISPTVTSIFGVDAPMYAAEIGLPAYYHRYPPVTEAHALPAMPSIERDVSAIVDERVRWSDVKSATEALRLQHLEFIEFVTAYRGKQIGSGKKSLTMRLRFRADHVTLKHDEVNPQMELLMQALQQQFGAVIRR